MTGPLDGTVAWLSIRQLFVRRRIVGAVVVSLVPLLIAGIFRATQSGGDAGRAQFLAELYRNIVVGTLLPLVAVVLGTTVFAAEIDDGTLIYLLVKPLARWRVVLTRYVVAVVSTAAVMLPAILLPWIVLGTGAAAGWVPLAFGAGAGLDILLYCALFVAMGIAAKRAAVLGILYIVLVELVMAPQVAGMKSLSIREFAITIAGRLSAGQPGVVAGTVSLATVWTMSGVILVGSLAFAMRRLRTYQMAERL
jgi:ABC-2 type transport system permease protein